MVSETRKVFVEMVLTLGIDKAFGRERDSTRQSRLGAGLRYKYVGLGEVSLGVP